MTVSTTTSYQTFAGAQSVLTFTFRTLVSNPEYISVKVVNLTNNTSLVLTYSTNYTVSVNASGVGGTVTVTPTYSSAYQYVVYRSTGQVQNSAYANFNQFPASTLENGLDQLTMLVQEQTTNQNLNLSLPLGLSPTASTVLPAPVANQALGWNNAGTGIVNINLVSQGTMVLASSADASGGVQSTHYMTPSTNTIQIQAAISSSTSDITVTTNSTQVLISAINVGTAGSSVIIKSTSAGNLPVSFSVGSTTISGTFATATIGPLLGAWTSKSPNGTVYQAASDGLVVVYSTGGGETVICYSDSSNPPTTVRCQSFVSVGATSSEIPNFFPVKKNDYFKVSTADTMFFISLGT